MLSLYVSAYGNSEGATDRQGSKNLTPAVASCAVVIQRLKWEATAVSSCQSETCRVAPRAALFPKLLVWTQPRWHGHFTSSWYLVKRTAATAVKKIWLYTAKYEFAMTLLGLWLHKPSLFWKSWTFIIPRKITTHRHPTAYYDGHLNLLWNSKSNIDYCPNIKYCSAATREQDEQCWCASPTSHKGKMVYKALSVAWSSGQVFINRDVLAYFVYIDFKNATEKTCLSYGSEFKSPRGLLIDGAN